MAKVTFVKSARKDNPVAKKGESYYWWKPMVGGRGGAKRYSKERPSRSQLTQSEFLSALYGIEDGDMASAQTPEEFKSIAEALRDLGQEQQDKYDNMPEGLQQGDTGQMLEERAQNCESWADEIEQRADELETALEGFDERWQAWADYREAQDAYDDLDEDEQEAADEPEEPDSDEPEGSSSEEAKQAIIDEHRDVFENNPF
jgi:flagellar biosynthesis chaperone FliJ